MNIILTDLRSGAGPLPVSALRVISRVLTLTFAVRAPATWWSELGTYNLRWTLRPVRFPLSLEDFAVPADLDDVERVNEVWDEPVLRDGLLPLGVYQTGLLTLTYAELDAIALQNQFNPSYEWQRFLQGARRAVVLFDLCPNLYAIVEDPAL